MWNGITPILKARPISTRTVPRITSASPEPALLSAVLIASKPNEPVAP